MPHLGRFYTTAVTESIDSIRWCRPWPNRSGIRATEDMTLSLGVLVNRFPEVREDMPSLLDWLHRVRETLCVSEADS